jgi:hypothetical protein
LYRIVFAAGSGRHPRDKSATRNDRHGTVVPAQPMAGQVVISGFVQKGRPRMSNPNQNPGQQNQNPGQQNQTPGQKPGQQQQGGGQQKPGQQQQNPNK